jgi:uncharacterized protein
MTKILIAGVSVRAMAESAICSGYTVIALDAFGDRDLGSLTESYSLHHDYNVRYSAQEILKAGQRLAFDAVAYTSDLENHPEVIDEFARNHAILGNSSKAVALVRTWASLYAGLRRAGFLVPATIFREDNCKPDPDRRWLIKPLSSGGGHGIAFLHDKQMLSEKCMLQEFLPGRPCSISFVANGRECVVLGITEQLIGMHQFSSQDFRYCGNLLPCPEAIDSRMGIPILDQARRLASFLTKEYGLVGVNGMDVIFQGDRICLTEVNPRYSASMELIERAYGLPVFQLHARAILDGALPDFALENSWTENKFFGKAILFAEEDTIAPNTDSWLAEGLHDVPVTGERLLKGGPICTILAARPDYDKTIAALVDQAGKLRERIYG